MIQELVIYDFRNICNVARKTKQNIYKTVIKRCLMVQN